MQFEIITLDVFAELRPDMVELEFGEDGSIAGKHPVAGAIRFTPVCGITGRGVVERVDPEVGAMLHCT
jgi:hypothetical protein